MAYNRPKSLQRLLASIAIAHYPDEINIPLVISLDKSDSLEVKHIAEGFEWQFGEKEIIAHEERLGLMAHFLYCGGLSEKHESIIFLEDDFYISPAFYKYAQQALDYYIDAEEIALLPLYALQLNGFTHQPFQPILDSADVFFAQVGWFKGVAVTAQQWNNFIEWLENKPTGFDPSIPQIWAVLGPEEWFPLFSSYLVDTQRYFVFPRQSLITDFSDAGMHFEEETNLYQTNLLLESKVFNFQKLGESLAVYDAFLELLPECINHLKPELAEYDYVVDLNASKQAHQLDAEYVITARPTRKTIMEFSTRMKPTEANVLHNIEGKGIVLTKTNDLRWDRRAEWKIKVQRYRAGQLATGLSEHIRLWFLARLDDLGLLG